MQLWVKIVIALIFGVGAGSILGSHAEILKPLGTLFLSLIHMIIALLVLSSMTVGITNIHDPEKLGRVGLKALFFYVTTTAISAAIGIAIAKLFGPGLSLHLETTSTVSAVVPPSFGEIFLSLVPTNPIKALAEGNVLQIIVFSLFLGIAINFSGEKGRPLLELLESLADVMYRLTSIIMEFSPIGVFAIMAWVAGSFGIGVLLPLLKFLFAYYLACFLQGGLVFGSMLKFLARLDPLPFFKGLGDAIMVAFSTCSSSATLPILMHCVQRNLGVSKNISSFMLPLGSTINMNGAAIFQGMAAVFISQAYGLDLSIQNLLTIVATATLAAVGAAGVPGSGFIMLTVVFSSVGLPIEGLAILAGIDRVREMVSTVLNILGDGVTCVLVAKQEGELDERQYYHDELIELEGSDI